MTEWEFRERAKKDGWTNNEIENEISEHNQSEINLPYETALENHSTIIRSYEIGEDGMLRDIEKHL